MEISNDCLFDEAVHEYCQLVMDRRLDVLSQGYFGSERTVQNQFETCPFPRSIEGEAIAPHSLDRRHNRLGEPLKLGAVRAREGTPQPEQTNVANLVNHLLDQIAAAVLQRAERLVG